MSEFPRVLEGVLSELVATASDGESAAALRGGAFPTAAPSGLGSTAEAAAASCRAVLHELRRAAGPRWPACVRAVAGAGAGAAPSIHVHRFLAGCEDQGVMNLS